MKCINLKNMTSTHLPSPHTPKSMFLLILPVNSQPVNFLHTQFAFTCNKIICVCSFSSAILFGYKSELHRELYSFLTMEKFASFSFFYHSNAIIIFSSLNAFMGAYLEQMWGIQIAIAQTFRMKHCKVFYSFIIQLITEVRIRITNLEGIIS